MSRRAPRARHDHMDGEKFASTHPNLHQTKSRASSGGRARPSRIFAGNPYRDTAQRTLAMSCQSLLGLLLVRTFRVSCPAPCAIATVAIPLVGGERRRGEQRASVAARFAITPRRRLPPLSFSGTARKYPALCHLSHSQAHCGRKAMSLRRSMCKDHSTRLIWIQYFHIFHMTLLTTTKHKAVEMEGGGGRSRRGEERSELRGVRARYLGGCS